MCSFYLLYNRTWFGVLKLTYPQGPGRQQKWPSRDVHAGQCVVRCAALNPSRLVVWKCGHRIATLLCPPLPQEAGNAEFHTKYYLFTFLKYIHWPNMVISFVSFPQR